MSMRFTIDGLPELLEALRQLPAALTKEASTIVELAAARAVADMAKEYGPVSELTDGLFTSNMRLGQFGTGVLVKNRSGWAYAWDHGTAERHTSGGQRKGHGTGAEWGGKNKKPPHTFARNMAQKRDRMYEDFAALLARHGLEVSVT